MSALQQGVHRFVRENGAASSAFYPVTFDAIFIKYIYFLVAILNETLLKGTVTFTLILSPSEAAMV